VPLGQPPLKPSGHSRWHAAQHWWEKRCTSIYVSNVATPWLWWVALLLRLPHPTHARRGGNTTREMTGRASDGSDSYSYVWGVAACGSAISGEASCAAEG
jgi:hypothetical protein